MGHIAHRENSSNQNTYDYIITYIELAFEHIKMSKYTHFTIFSDSFSQSLHSLNIDHPYISDILYSYYNVSNQGKIVKFCWIPSHIGIHWNIEADRAAYSALVFEKFLLQTF